MRICRTDRNQAAIVKAIESIGASVQCLHTVGGGCPDLLVGFRGINFLFEVKDGEKAPSKRKLTNVQKEWHPLWRGSAHIVKNSEEAIEILQK
jgi:hypothetical protein